MYLRQLGAKIEYLEKEGLSTIKDWSSGAVWRPIMKFEFLQVPVANIFRHC